MNRRKFLKQTAFVSIGGILLPSFLSSCRKNNPLDDIEYTGNVIIIGAGAAGLYAGYILKSKSINFQILEASSGHGGRLGKLTGFADYPIDKGGQWLHGRNNLLGDLIAKTQTKITLDDSTESFWFNNAIVNELPKDIFIFEEDGLPDVSFKDYATQKGFGTEYDYIVESIAGDQGADASALSAYWNNEEEKNWNSGDKDYKFDQTFFDLIDQQIAATVIDKISYNTAVIKIDYTQTQITITDQNGLTYTADKVIVCVPITMLKTNAIEFLPTLSSEKTEAFSKIGMTAGMKVFLKFSAKFYDSFILGGTTCAAYADDTVGKTSNDHILLAFVMGEQAEFLTSLGSDAAIVAALIQELDVMYNGQATTNLLDSNVQNFSNRPYIMGAYSFSTVGMGNAREIAAQSVDNKLFFAGEAMNTNGHHQTVHGAVETGYREVINILDAL